LTPAVAVVFPGQGTQEVGMGAAWRDRPEWSVVERAEAILDEPLAHLLLHAEAETLRRTRNAQLAVLLTSLVAWESLRDRLQPIAFAGHSLGQVTALVASGALLLDQGLRFAAARAERTQAAADAAPGVMAALLGAEIAQAEAAHDAAPDGCWLANDNAPGQLVIAGTSAGVDAGIDAAKAAGTRRVRRLDVGGAFHTPLMEPAATALADDLASVTFATPSAPVVANTDATAHDSAEGWGARSADHVTRPVRWRESQTALTALGATVFVEVGHGSMLAALARRTVPDVTLHAVATPEDAASL
jgi:[acyl-carrier-protein] S-malonyltransferase